MKPAIDPVADAVLTEAAGQSRRLILHLGLGAFHRAHQAVYLQRLLAQGDRSWAIIGANIRPDAPQVLEALRTQHGQYTLETVSPEGVTTYERITAIAAVLPWQDNFTALTAVGSAALTRIISFTVTEAGYYLAPDDSLDWSSPALLRDLERARAPQAGPAVPTPATGEAGATIYGALQLILRARMLADAGPVTLLNCDNLRHNGTRLRAGLLEFVDRTGDMALSTWIRSNTTCPCAMVDRITPRPPPALRQRVLEATGVDDPVPVTAESFIQWVIEDDFAAGRPAWERVDVTLVQSVAPYEEAKIRILNASHSCIAWAGTLVGMTYIHEGTRDPAIRQMAFDYVTDDVMPCLDRPQSPSPIDLARYRDVVLDRFGNEAIRDTNQRVAMDGFAKIAGFLAPTIRERLARGESIVSSSLVPALFLSFLQRWHVQTLPYEYADQSMDPQVAHGICAADDPIAAFCADPGLWGDLVASPALVAAIRAAHARVEAFLATRNRKTPA